MGSMHCDSLPWIGSLSPPLSTIDAHTSGQNEWPPLSRHFNAPSRSALLSEVYA